MKTYFKEAKKAYKIICHYARALLVLFAVSMLINPIFALCTTLLPSKFIGNLSSITTNNLSLSGFLYICMPAILYFILDSVIFSLYFMLSQRAEKRIFARLALKLHKESSDKIEKVDIEYFDIPETYNIIYNGRQYDYNIAKEIVRRPFGLVGDILTYLGFMVILLPLGKWCVFLLIASSVVTYFISTWIEKYKNNIKRTSTKERRKYDYWMDLIQNKENIKELRIYRLFLVFREKLNTSHRILERYSLREFKHTQCCNVVSYMVSEIPIWIIYIYIVIRVYQKSLSIEEFVLFTSAVSNFVAYTKNFVHMFTQMYSESLSLEYYNEFCSIPNNILADNKKQEISELDFISFQNVTFRYPGMVSSVLQDISFEVPQGSLVCIVGPNGSGKSSLVKLLMRLYDPEYGSVLINHQDIRDFNAASWYEKQSVLFQDYHTFAMSVAENIELGQHDIVKLERACREGQCEKMISKLPQRYQTELSRLFCENGVELSGGEAQRICLSRAYYKDAEILILDEPSAAIDPITESKILESIYSKRGDMTIFVISHRLSIAKKSDLILVLDKGVLKEKGTHSQLINLNGLYAELYNAQAERYT